MISEFAKEKVHWTRKMNLKLVRFIENKPIIWNPKHPKYTSVAARDQTYQEFASLYGNKFTSEAVRDRWTNIRSTFSKHLRRRLANQAQNGEEIKSNSNWPLWEPCQFLMKVNRKLKPDLADLEEEFSEEEEYANNEETTETTVERSNEERPTLENNSDNYEVNNTPTCTAIAESVAEVFKGLQNDSFGIDDSKNGQIGTMVAKALSCKNSFEAASAAQKIMNILLLYDPNNPINPNNLKSDDDDDI